MVDSVKIFCHTVLIGVGHDGFLTGKHFLHKAVHDSVIFGAFHISRLGNLPHLGHIGNGYGNCHHRHQRQRGRYVNHHAEGSHHRHQAGEYLHHIRGKAGAYHVYVIRHTADDVSRLVSVKVSHRQPHQLVKHILPHFFRYQPADIHHDNIDGNGEHGGQHIAQQHPFCVIKNRFKIYLSDSGSGLADGCPCKAGSQQGQYIADKAQYKYQHQNPFIVSDIADHTFKSSPGIPGFFPNCISGRHDSFLSAASDFTYRGRRDTGNAKHFPARASGHVSSPSASCRFPDTCRSFPAVLHVCRVRSFCPRPGQ